jgi:hypothetical protein
MLHFINQNGHKITDFELGYCFIYFSPAKVRIDSRMDEVFTFKPSVDFDKYHICIGNIWF